MAEEDQALKALEVMTTEFVSHKQRLALRAKVVAEAIASGQIADVAALGGVVVELFQELHDTSLSFQQELTELIKAEWAKADDEDDDFDDEEEVADDADAPLDDDPSQLLPGDAAQLRRTATEHRAMLNAMLAPEFQNDEAGRAELQKKLADADQSLELIDALELRDDDEAPADTAPAN